MRNWFGTPLSSLVSVRGLAPFVLSLLLFPISAAQDDPSATGTTKQFEVASIRAAAPYSEAEIRSGAANNPLSPFPASRFTAHRVTLSLLINLAYDIPQRYTEGEPNWAESQLYDVDAKVGGDQQLSYEQMKPLLQNLLKQRFHLSARITEREVRGYGLVPVKDGSKLKPSGSSVAGQAYISHTGLRVRGNMAVLASMLASPLDAPVADKTELSGTYDIDLHYRPADDMGSNLPDIFTAVQEQLGLKLVQAKVPVKYLAIDHIDRVPTEN